MSTYRCARASARQSPSPTGRFTRSRRFEVPMEFYPRLAGAKRRSGAVGGGDGCSPWRPTEAASRAGKHHTAERAGVRGAARCVGGQHGRGRAGVCARERAGQDHKLQLPQDQGCHEVRPRREQQPGRAQLPSLCLHLRICRHPPFGARRFTTSTNSSCNRSLLALARAHRGMLTYAATRVGAYLGEHTRPTRGRVCHAVRGCECSRLC